MGALSQCEGGLCPLLQHSGAQGCFVPTKPILEAPTEHRPIDTQPWVQVSEPPSESTCLPHVLVSAPFPGAKVGVPKGTAWIYWGAAR